MTEQLTFCHRTDMLLNTDTENDVTVPMEYRMSFLGLNFMSGLLYTIKPKKP